VTIALILAVLALGRPPNLGPLYRAIWQEESVNGTKLVSDRGRSLGDYHIGRAYWTDACEFGRVSWSYDRYVWSRAHSEQVMLWYWSRYCPDALRRGDYETLARTHNGGPRGARKTSTLRYWRRVRSAISEKGARQ